MTEKKKDDMDVDQEGSKKDYTGTKEPTPRGTEAGKVDPSEILQRGYLRGVPEDCS